MAEAEVDNRRAATCQTPEGTPPRVSALSEEVQLSSRIKGATEADKGATKGWQRQGKGATNAWHGRGVGANGYGKG